MGQIRLKGPDTYSVTPLSNYFIDEIMPDANGEFVKVYLYLLRVLSSSDNNISICHIADKLNHTEKDVIRALKYWEQAGLLQLQKDSRNQLTGIQLLDLPHIKDSATNDMTAKDTTPEEFLTQEPLTEEPLRKRSYSKNSFTKGISSREDVSREDISREDISREDISKDSAVEPKESQPPRKSYSASEVSRFKENQEVVQLLYVAERYMGRNLSKSDVNVLLYIYDELRMPVELIEYLLEYCISNNHTSNRYIEKTAMNWAEEGIDTVEKAKANSTLYSRICYPILNAFGITGRVPVKHEKDLIFKWTDNYGFSIDIILEACERTMKTATPPSFNYADGILTKWYQHGIRTKADLEPLDQEHKMKKSQQQTKAGTTAKPSGNKSGNNSFNNFQQRNYDYDTLERELLGNTPS